MNAKTLKALKGSIRKWENIAKGKDHDEGVNNCPLCELFYFVNDCLGCPVYLKTGLQDCSNSPYAKFAQHWWEGDPHLIDLPCPICTKLAKEELKFLRSLLPKTKTK